MALSQILDVLDDDFRCPGASNKPKQQINPYPKN